jgi:YVTN family beta-propeller protein
MLDPCVRPREAGWRLLAAALLVACTPGGAQTLDGTLLVANREDVAGSVSLFDLRTEKEIARLPIGPGWPHEIAVSPDGRLALTAEYGLDAPGERVAVIDVVGARLLGHIPMGSGSKPHDSVFLPDNRHAVVTLETTDELAVVDVATFSIVRRLAIGSDAREGHMIALSADARRVYVGGRISGTVSIVPLDGTVPVVLETGAGAEAIAIAPNGEVWVLNQDANTISIIDPAARAIAATFPSATQPRRLASLPGGEMAIINGNASTAGVLLYDVSTRGVVRELAVTGEAAGAGGFGFLAVGNVLFVSTRADGRILLYDLEHSRETPRVFATHHETPDGMAWSPLRVGALIQPQERQP